MGGGRGVAGGVRVSANGCAPRGGSFKSEAVLGRPGWIAQGRCKYVLVSSVAACSCALSCAHGKTGVGRPAQPARGMPRAHAAHAPAHHGHSCRAEPCSAALQRDDWNPRHARQPSIGSALQQLAKHRLQPAAFQLEVVALLAPGGSVVPLRARTQASDWAGSGGRARAPAHTRTLPDDRAPGPGPVPCCRRGQRAPLRGHHLQPQAAGGARQSGQVLRQPAADVGAGLGFVEFAQQTAQGGVAAAGRPLHAGAVRVDLRARVAAFLPAQRQQFAAQGSTPSSPGCNGGGRPWPWYCRSCSANQSRCCSRKRSPITVLARGGRVRRAPRSSTLSLMRRARGSRTRRTSISASSVRRRTVSRCTVAGGVGLIRRRSRRLMRPA